MKLHQAATGGAIVCKRFSISFLVAMHATVRWARAVLHGTTHRPQRRPQRLLVVST